MNISLVFPFCGKFNRLTAMQRVPTMVTCQSPRYKCIECCLEAIISSGTNRKISRLAKNGTAQFPDELFGLIYPASVRYVHETFVNTQHFDTGHARLHEIEHLTGHRFVGLEVVRQRHQGGTFLLRVSQPAAILNAVPSRLNLATRQSTDRSAVTHRVVHTRAHSAPTSVRDGH